MEQKRLSAILLAAGMLAVLGVCAAEGMMTGYLSAQTNLKSVLPMLCMLWAAGLAFLAALYQYARICVNIGHGMSFCRENAQRMKRISILLAAAAVFGFIACVGLLAAAQTGWLLSGLAGLACAAMSMLAFVLHKLLKNAAELKDENDLTI